MDDYGDEFRNKVVVVTGAAQGIGLGIAGGFAARGARVVMADVNGDAVKEKAVALGGHTVGMEVDVTDPASVGDLAAAVLDRHGRVDVLVNNAGILKSHFITDFPVEDWNAVIAVNLTGTFLCTKVFGKIFVGQRDGCIVNVNSKSGKKGGLWNAAYCASKFGGIGLTQSAALDLARYNVRVNAVCPGNVMSTPLWNVLDKMYARKLNTTPEEVRRIYREKVPLGRNTEVEDVVRAVLFLASSRASFITGEALNVSGGEEMR